MSHHRFIRSKTIDSAPLFKFMYLVVGPTLLWAQSVVLAGPDGAGPITFGQVQNFDAFFSNPYDTHTSLISRFSP